MRFINKIHVIWWNKTEFFVYLLLLAPIIYFGDWTNLGINPSMSLSISILVLLLGLILSRYFDRIKEYEGYARTFRSIHISLCVWTTDLTTLTTNWKSQLLWLKRQMRDTEKIRKLDPHLFHQIDVSAINQLPDFLGENDLMEYKSSIVAISHYVNDCLNLIVKKLHFREKLGKDEWAEIERMLFHVEDHLSQDLPKVECETNRLLSLID